MEDMKCMYMYRATCKNYTYQNDWSTKSKASTLIQQGTK